MQDSERSSLLEEAILVPGRILDLAENREILNVLVVISYEINHPVTTFPQLLRIHWLQLPLHLSGKARLREKDMQKVCKKRRQRQRERGSEGESLK